MIMIVLLATMTVSKQEAIRNEWNLFTWELTSYVAIMHRSWYLERPSMIG